VRVPGDNRTWRQQQIQPTPVRVPGDIGICKQQQIQQHHPQVRVPGDTETCKPVRRHF
jgi:hypothetical protein